MMLTLASLRFCSLRRHILPITYAALAASGLGLVGCAQKGASPTKGTPPPVEQNQTEAESEQSTLPSTTVGLTAPTPYTPAAADLACTAPAVLAAPPTLQTAKVIDGNPGDWDQSTKLMTDPVGDSQSASADEGDLLSLRAELSDNHLWLLIELSPSAGSDQLQLNLGRLQIGPDKILNNESQHLLTITGTAVSHTDVKGNVTPIDGSEVARQGNFVEAKIPAGRVKLTLAEASWWLQVGYFSLDQRTASGEPLPMDMMARRYFPSVLQTNQPTWFFEGCRLAEDPLSPRIWLIRNFAGRDAAYLTKLKVARHSVASFSRLSGNLKTKRLDDINFIDIRGVSGQNHSSLKAMPNRSVLTLMTENLAGPALQQRQFETIFKTLTDFYLYQSHPQFGDWPIAPLFKQALTTAGQCHYLGIKTYLERFPSVSHQPAAAFEEFAQIFLASFPTDSLYHFVEGLASSEDLSAVTATTLKARLASSEQAGNLCQKLPRLSQVTLDDIWAGWLDTELPYEQRFHPTVLLDKDADSLPQLWEDHLRLDSQNFDSDRDGFSDLSELIAATSPQDDLSYPGQLMLDEEFSDWHKLIGSLITADKDASTTQCARSLDLLFSGAIYSQPSLHVGYQFSPIGHDFPYYFEARLQFAGLPQQFMAVLRHDTPGYVLKNASTGEVVHRDPFATPCGQRACELSLPLAKMGMRAEEMTANQPVTVQIKGYKLGSQPRLCDQTEPFSPIQKR